MNRAKVLWTPYPFKAGFCITDDTDGIDFRRRKILYDYLRSIKLYTSMNVWLYKATEPSGKPHVILDSSETLENKEYFSYCQTLSKEGFEICLHGASAGNNKREITIKAIDTMREFFDGAKTYIGHCKNAENIYWEEKVATTQLIKFLIKCYSRHKAFGEDENSEYFWGDYCQKYINQIRLYRTRNLNTLAVNPSMPYFEPDKTFVNSWFSATKRSFWDCTTNQALNSLKSCNGLTVLYQYLTAYVDKKSLKIDSKFLEASRRLMDDQEIWVANVDIIMKRLKQIQKIFIFYDNSYLIICNINNTSVKNLQIELPKDDMKLINEICQYTVNNSILNIEEIKNGEFLYFSADSPVKISGNRSKKLPKNKKIKIKIMDKYICFNLSSTDWQVKQGIIVRPNSFTYFPRQKEDKVRPLSFLTRKEYYRLFFEQFLIIIREIVFKGRIFNVKKYVNAEKIKMNDYENW